MIILIVYFEPIDIASSLIHGMVILIGGNLCYENSKLKERVFIWLRYGFLPLSLTKQRVRFPAKGLAAHRSSIRSIVMFFLQLRYTLI